MYYMYYMYYNWLDNHHQMLTPIFTLNVGHRLLPGRVTLGEFDGKHPCLAAATIAEKVFVHNPHQRMGHLSGRMVASSGNQEVSMLNINININIR